MVTPKNNPHVLLEAEGITKTMLSAKAAKALELFSQAQSVSVKHPNSKELNAQAEKAGMLACGIIRQEANRLKEIVKNDIEETHKKAVKKTQSRMIVERSEQTLDELAFCRQKLKEDRRRKMESGEIAKPKKKPLTVKLRHELGKIVGLIPGKLKEDTNVITRTEKAVLKFLNELKSIWGMDKIKAIEDEIAKKVDKLREQAA